MKVPIRKAIKFGAACLTFARNFAARGLLLSALQRAVS
jgi:hypothetical protein